MAWKKRGQWVLMPARKGPNSPFTPTGQKIKGRPYLTALFVDISPAPARVSVICTGTDIKPSWNNAALIYQHLDESIGKQKGGQLEGQVARLGYPSVFQWNPYAKTIEVRPFRWIKDLTIEIHCDS